MFEPIAGPPQPSLFALTPFASAAPFLALEDTFAKDAEYQAAAAPYADATAADPAYVRQETWLLQAFPTFPRVELPPQTAAKAPRIFELRIYESASEKAHLKKVEMFEKLGEIAIFKRTGLVAGVLRADDRRAADAVPRLPARARLARRAREELEHASSAIRSGARSRRRRASPTRTSSRTSPPGCCGRRRRPRSERRAPSPRSTLDYIHMRLFQVLDAQGRLCPGALAGDRADVATAGQAGFASTLDLLTAADQDGLDLAGWFDEQRTGGVTVSVDWAALEKTGKAGGFTLAIPIVPPEVWGAGVTYRRSADFREEGLGIYDKIYEAPRPELFFKATASRSAGPHQPIGRRKDSAFTAAEPEVCVIVSRGGAILGYTLANDVSAWDIERDNPLYLPQSKVYDGCFSCGPTIVTPDEVADPYAIEVTMVVSRGTTEVFKGSASTSQLKRKLPDLVDWLRKSNDVPTGTVLSTGTGIIQPLGSGLEPGDIVVISSPQLGTLSNPVAFV